MSSPAENDRPPASGEPPRRSHDHGARPLSDRTVAGFFIMLAAALVLGYLLLNKLVNISRQEDCLLAHRRDCAAADSPSR